MIHVLISDWYTIQAKRMRQEKKASRKRDRKGEERGRAKTQKEIEHRDGDRSKADTS
jgi:hypothetical protein